MKKLDLETFGSNLKKCIKTFNDKGEQKFQKVFEKAYDDEVSNLSDYSIIYRYQSGKKRPSLESLVLIADLLNVSLEELLS